MRGLAQIETFVHLINSCVGRQGSSLKPAQYKPSVVSVHWEKEDTDNKQMIINLK